jgi:hypothetical protein
MIKARSMAVRCVAVSLIAGIPFMGCGALNPAFVNQLGGGLAASLTTVDNATGHIVVTFSNNARIDEQLLNFLLADAATNLPGLLDVAAGTLKPAVRFRLLITYTDLSQATFEFASGTELLASPGFEEAVVTNVVFPCGVLSVELDPARPIEVYVPVELAEYELVQVAGAGGDVQRTEFEIRERIPAQWEQLEVDDTDEQDFVTLQRNFAPGDTPAPITPSCGSVVALVLEGALTVPFLIGVDEAPSYDRDDESTVAGIGGRYRFVTQVN